MNKFNDIEVIINNKRYTLSGYESAEFLQRVATYINNKHNEIKGKEAYKFMDGDMKSILVQTNIADDYFKALDRIKDIEADYEQKNKEIYDIRHELISAQAILASSLKENEELKAELNDAQKKIVRLETELHDARKQ